MKKTAAGFALAAVLGLSVASATPAMAVVGAYENCGAAAADGVYNIPVGAPGYGPHLDRDGDGIGCENSEFAYRPAPETAPVPEAVPVPETAPVPETPSPVVVTPAPAPQIVQVPAGAPDTGVAQEPSNTSLAFLFAAGAALVTAAGASVASRRKASNV